jgi:hypothetical protein
MNTILTSSISDPNIQQPFTGKSLTFLQNSYTNIFDSVCKSIIGDRNYSGLGFYAISGLRNTGTPPAYVIPEGWIFYDGQMYYCSGYSGTPVNDVIGTITVTYDTSIDPVTFTDGIARNVHRIQTIVLSDGVSGSADFDYDDLDFAQDSFYRKFAQGAYSGTSATGTTILPLSTSEIDPNSWLNGGTGKFLPTESGYYEISAQYVLNAAAAISPTVNSLAIYKNGVSDRTIGGVSDYQGNDDIRHASGTHIVLLNGTTDYIELKAIQDTSQVINYIVYFTAKKISE